MSIYLPQTRLLVDAPTQSGQNVFDDTPFGVDLDYDFAPIEKVDIEVTGGDVFSGREGTNHVHAWIEYDELGRPVREVVINSDREEATDVFWEYEGLKPDSDYVTRNKEPIDDYQSYHSNGSVEVLRNGMWFFLQYETADNGDLVHRLVDVDDALVELATYADDGKLTSLVLVNGDKRASIKYRYDTRGRLVETETSPGGETLRRDQPSEVNIPNISAISYENPGHLIVRNLIAMKTLNAEINVHYDEERRPTSISAIRGIEGLGRATTETTVQYVQQKSFQSSVNT